MDIVYPKDRRRQRFLKHMHFLKRNNGKTDTTVCVSSIVGRTRSQYACLSFFSMQSGLLKSTIKVTYFQNPPNLCLEKTVSFDRCS